jgi:muramoyltetrapeptide carboxypeptidase LdcA involved in peptidoglycan recycling
MSRKLDEQGKSKKNLQQQIRHTKDRLQDAEFAVEHEQMSEERRKELETKNEHRRKDMHAKTKELGEE